MQNSYLTAGHDRIAEVDGWPINIANEAEAVTKVLGSAQRGESFAVFTLNMDHLVKLRESAKFRSAYRKARYVTADGAPVARLASNVGLRVDRTTGADLLVSLASGAAERKLPVYLYGTTPDILRRSASSLCEASGNRLNIVGTNSPPHGFDPEGDEADAALEAIGASGARLCFVALGAPKQEVLAARAVAKGIPVGFVCIGAGLDFLAGAQHRAPKAMQHYGLEWLWRLATNPRRLAGRYARCAMVLADILLWKPLMKSRRQSAAS